MATVLAAAALGLPAAGCSAARRRARRAFGCDPSAGDDLAGARGDDRVGGSVLGRRRALGRSRERLRRGPDAQAPGLDPDDLAARRPLRRRDRDALAPRRAAQQPDLPADLERKTRPPGNARSAHEDRPPRLEPRQLLVCMPGAGRRRLDAVQHDDLPPGRRAGLRLAAPAQGRPYRPEPPRSAGGVGIGARQEERGRGEPCGSPRPLLETDRLGGAGEPARADASAHGDLDHRGEGRKVVALVLGHVPSRALRVQQAAHELARLGLVGADPVPALGGQASPAGRPPWSASKR